MQHFQQAEDLADLIEANPRIKIDIDNDCWYINKQPDPTSDIHTGDEDEDLMDSSRIVWNTQWYGHSSNYGAGVAEALIILLNRRGFNIEASGT